jgi:hypothetical protein
MHHDELEINGESLLSVKDAFIAMFRFVDSYWVRGERHDGSITLLRHAIEPSHDPNTQADLWTNDPAMWSDWINAVRVARRDGIPTESDSS